MSLPERKWFSNDETGKSFSSPHLFSLQNAVYKGEFTATHPTVRLFWEVFHEFPLEKKKQFLCKHLISSSLNLHDSLITVWFSRCHPGCYKYCKDVQVIPGLSWEYTVKAESACSLPSLKPEHVAHYPQSAVENESCVVLHELIKV